MVTFERTKGSYVAAWVAIVLAVGGAMLLYPIGSGPLNWLFILIKICMVAGLLAYLFARQPRVGFWAWTIASWCAVVMTACKWFAFGPSTPWNILLYIGSMVVDLGMPALVRHLSRRA